MFGNSFWGQRYFGDRYWGPGSVIPPIPPVEESGPGSGGGEEEWQRYLAERRARERELERKLEGQRREAEELRTRRDRAQEELQRKARAKKESKARKVLQERLDRFDLLLEQAELQITETLVEIRRLQEALAFRADRRRRLLLLTALMQ